MRHKKKLTIILILCFLILTGGIFYKIEIITDNGGPLIDLDGQFELLRQEAAEQKDEDKEELVDEPKDPLVTWRITINYDRVTFMGSVYRYSGHDSSVAAESLVNEKGESFEEALLGRFKDTQKDRTGYFLISDDYAEYYTEGYVVECLEKNAGDSRIEFESDFR